MEKRIKTREEFIKEFIERDRKQKEITSKREYIIWLGEFTKKYPQFADYEFVYDRQKITDSDFNNINNLSLLFEGIRKYANNNYLYARSDEFLMEYKIKYLGTGYKIGLITGQGSYFFCERISNPDDTFIDFNDIMSNSKLPNTEFINNKLIELSNIISYYYELGIPLPALQETVNNTLNEIKELELEKNTKKLGKHL